MKTSAPALPEFDEFSHEEMSNYVKTLRGPYSQVELAHILKVDPSAVDNWEHGRARPQPRMIRRMLQHYRDWALQQELCFAASHAASAAGIKKDLTTPPRDDTSGKPYIPVGE